MNFSGSWVGGVVAGRMKTAQGRYVKILMNSSISSDLTSFLAIIVGGLSTTLGGGGKVIQKRHKVARHLANHFSVLVMS